MTIAIKELAEHPFLSGIEPSSLARVAEFSQWSEFKPGAALMREGDPADVVYLVQRGRVSLDTQMPGHAPVRLETIGEGSVVGLSWMFPPYRVHIDARALEPVRAIAIATEPLRAAMDRDEHLGYAFTKRMLRIVYERLERVRLQRLDVYGK
jgi:CRP-like cAMP-binding protein